MQGPLFCLLDGQELFLPGGGGSAAGSSAPWCIRGMGLVVGWAVVAVGILSVDYIKILQDDGMRFCVGEGGIKKSSCRGQDDLNRGSISRDYFFTITTRFR